MDLNPIEVTTEVQLLFHVNNGEVVIMPLQDGDFFIKKEKDGRYLAILQH